MKKKTEWNERTGRSSMEPPSKLTWEHDVTKERFMQMVYLTKKKSSKKLKWADCVVGGNVAVCAGGEEFEMKIAFRGFGIPGVIAFDEKGFGAVFV